MQRPRLALTFLAFALILLLAGPGGPIGAPGSGSPLPAHVPGEVLLKLKPAARLADKHLLQAELGAVTANVFNSAAERWTLGPGVTVERALQRLQASPSVEYAEPNYILTTGVVPNDPRYPELWGMNNTGQTGGTNDADIDAETAWNVSTGSSNVLVAVIDTGVDYNHPDLAANIWTNPGEIAGNGLDDDGNGYVDDIHGWDFVNNDGDPFDDNGHGTHCSGTIGGVGNNGIGVAGVNWNVKIMAAKFLSSGGSGSTANAVLAVQYTTMMGVDVTSNSWGGGSFSQTLYDAIAAAGNANIAFVAAAGNNGQNSDTSPAYPAAYNLPNIISVAATDDNDQLASFSNWGAVSVDLAAPGVDVLSTLPGNQYGLLSGTSMATPHVTGAYALVKAVSAPDIPWAQVKNILMSSVDHIPAMAGKCVSNGRLNIFFAIAEPDTTAPGMIDDLQTTDPSSNTIGLTWTATGDDGGVGTANAYEIRYSMAPIDEGNWAAATRAGGEPAPAAAGTPQALEVRNLVADTSYFFAIKAFDEWGNPGPISNLATGTTLPPPTGEVAPTSVSDDMFTGEQSDHVVILSNVGQGTLDFDIPAPSLGEPMAQNPFLDLGKDESDPRVGDPVTQGAGGPDAFGYRWSDSDQPGGPAFAWTDISGTGTPITLSGDDSTSQPVAMSFNFPFYGTLFNSFRICTNGFLSFTSASTAYSNQPLPNSGAPENMIAPFWDDQNFTAGAQVFFQDFGNRAIVQWNNVPHYSSGGPYTYQAILESSGVITFQYLTMNAPLDSATIGLQNATKTDALQVAFNQAYMHDGLAIRISAIPQWLTAFPTSGRIAAGGSKAINLHMDASGLEGGTYPGTVNILTNDPQNPVLVVTASLHVIGAPDASVQPGSLAYGTSFLGQPYVQNLIVANNGTDTLQVSAINSSDPSLVPNPAAFNVPPHGSQNVAVTWTPSALGPFSGSLTVVSNDAAEPSIPVPVTGEAVPSPVMLWSPTSFNETLYSGNTVTRVLTVTNTGGPDLVVDAAADLGNGQLVYADDVGANGAGGPDAFGYRWKDSDASGGPTFNWVDISSTGTQITFSSSDDALSAAIPMGMTFPFYGSNFSSLKVSTNGWLTFSTTETSSRNTNSTLPSTSGAANMVAVFWDDLHLRTGNVRYRYDGTRFIVQYTNVGRFSPSTGQSYTFQVQLYPNGKIITQFLSMTASNLASATIGIQNSLKTIGLPANFNTAYVHDNLAVQFSRTPDWLAVTPSHAQIPPGQSANFNVTFDSTDRLGGVLNGAVVLNTNVPGQAQEQVPATLTVIGAPIASIVPASHAYGTRYTGYSYLTSFQVVNTGTDVLNVSDVYSDDPALFVEDVQREGGENTPEAAFPLAPGAARLFNLRWSPAAPGPLNALVHVISDDPTTPDKTMPVTGTAILPPVAGWTPTSFSEAMMAGEVLHRTIRVSNSGGSDLDFVTQVGLLTGAAVPVDHSPDLKKDEEDTRPGVLGAGGPDAYGYTWRDSDQAGGPAFSWVDIGAIGTPITFASSDDSNFGPINLGFPFPFYGSSFSQVRVTTNGWLSFTNTTTDLSNDLLPSSSSPENLIAVFHDDLYWRTSQGATAKYWTDGNRFIVQWTNWDQLTPSGENYTFQTILYRNGRIVCQYLNMTTNDIASATIGIQNAARNDGLTASFNTAYVHNNLAVEFRPPAGWLSLSPEAATVPPGGFVDIDVAFDATGLIGGDYSANIDFSTNDPANAAFRVPVALHVTGIPDVAVDNASLLFPTTYVGYTRSLGTVLRNVGTDVLDVTGVTVSGDFTQYGLVTPVSLPPGGSVPITVTFVPTAAGTRTGTIEITSSDPDEPTTSIALTGEALIPPVLAVAPSSLSAILPPASQTTRTVQVCNEGGSDLNWHSGTNIISGGSATQYAGVEKGKDDPDTEPGILGLGGPDVFGYRWIDSDNLVGPTFDWVDITGVGTPITELNADDEVVQGIPIGFNFPFYGNAFSTLMVSSNGWISFDYTGTSSLLTNAALPSTSGANSMIAGFWDDLSFSATHGSGRAYYHNDGSRFILSFVNVPHYSSPSTGLYTFQFILYPNGRIVTQYLTVSGTTLASQTIGIQNAAENDGLTVVYNSAYVHNDLAIEFKALPRWASVAPESGVVPAGTCQDVVVSIDSTDLDHGVHEASLRFQADNDPYLEFVDLPVTLTVNQKPIAVPAGATVECTGNNSAAATLSGAGSSDPDGDPITYLWSAPGIVFDDPTSVTPTATFPLGDTTVTLVVNDGYEDSDPATVVVRVQDTLPPTITSVGVTPTYLWPPNHNMATATTTVTATDVCDPSPVVLLVGTSSSEPDDAQGGGDGFTTNDIQGADTGTPDFEIQLRAERQGAGDGRIYTITYQAVDGSGNGSATAATEVDVPHSLGDVVEPIHLTLDGKSATVANWGVVTGAQHYDVIRGNLSELRISGSDVDLGRVTCIEQQSIDTSTAGNGDTAIPAPGQAFFYAVQFFDGVQDSSYGSESVGRARVIKNGNGNCP
ncbi:MAG TPA: S8 family serine peptidase [Candidatus Polarisedimenticolaceae bacterium]